MEEQDILEDQLPLESAGMRLRNARIAAGMSLADVARETKIAERHLAAIEEDRFSDLASRAYAVGFSRTFARAVGLSETSITDMVRTRLDEEGSGRRHTLPETFEPGDPARVPPARLAWLGGLGALLILLLVYLFWRSFLAPASPLPDLIGDPAPEATPSASAVTAAAPSGTPAGGTVVFTATEPGVWVKFYDASGTQLFQKQMAQGETYMVPADAQGPLLWTARPDALRITVDGKPVDGLADGPVTMKDVPVTAQALLARQAEMAPAAAASSAPATQATPAAKASPSPSPSPSQRLSPSPRPSPTPRPSAAPSASVAPSTGTGRTAASGSAEAALPRPAQTQTSPVSD